MTSLISVAYREAAEVVWPSVSNLQHLMILPAPGADFFVGRPTAPAVIKIGRLFAPGNYGSFLARPVSRPMMEKSAEAG
jgi:hypothetical protein